MATPYVCIVHRSVVCAVVYISARSVRATIYVHVPVHDNGQLELKLVSGVGCVVYSLIRTPEESVEMSSFSEVEMHARVVLGVGKGVLFCPQFRSVLFDGFHFSR